MEKKIDRIKNVRGSLEPLDPKAPDTETDKVPMIAKVFLHGTYPDGTPWEREATPDDEEYHYGE